MCFVHKPMQNADFGQILCRRASTKRHVTSRPTVRFSQTWYQKMRKTWKKKVMKRRVAICGGREAVADFVQGGVKLTPPPVKIGLREVPLPVQYFWHQKEDLIPVSIMVGFPYDAAYFWRQSWAVVPPPVHYFCHQKEDLIPAPIMVWFPSDDISPFLISDIRKKI